MQVAGDQAGVRSASARSADVAWLPRAPDAWLAARAAALLDLPVSHAESLQVVRYQPHGEYRAHLDGLPLDEARGRRMAVRGRSYAGQRRVTALLHRRRAEVIRLDPTSAGTTCSPERRKSQL